MNNSKISKSILVIIIILIGAMLLSCNSEKEVKTNQSQVEEQSKKSELVFVEREIACNTDPAYYPGSNHYISNGALETLFKIDPDGIVQPLLAKSAKQIDPNTWRIHLRPEGKFWSGKKIDVKAVIASLERSRETNARALPFLEGLDFKPLDEWTFEVKTKRENTSVPLNLAYMELGIIDADKAHDSVETMDMSGMYKVVKFEPKKRMVLETNPNYYGKKPTIKRIIHEEITDAETRALSILSGRADIVRHIPNESIKQLSNKDDIVLHGTPGSNTETIYLNLSKPQLKDIRVRQALSWGLDREELVLLGAEGQSIPLTTWLSSNPKYKEARNDVYTKYDPKKAGELLDEAGWKLEDDGIRYKDEKPLKIRLMTWGQDKALGEVIQNQWTKLGVKAEVQYGDYSLIETARDTGDWDAFIEAWQTYGDEFALLSGQFSPKGSANYGKYNDKKTNQLLDKLSKAITEEERHQLALEINKRVAEQAPAIFVYPRVDVTAIKASLKGFQEHFRQFENAINANLRFE